MKELLTILIVDDSAIIKERLLAMLQQMNKVGQVLMAGNYEEAIMKLEQQNIDVLILDIGLPGRNGLEVLQAIRRNNWTVISIVFTNQADACYRKICLLLGAYRFLDKTTEFDKIPEIITSMKTIPFKNSSMKL